MNATQASTGNSQTAESEKELCREQEMASFTSLISASLKHGNGVYDPVSSSNSPLPENLTTRFQKLSLRSTTDDNSFHNGVDLGKDTDDEGDPGNDVGIAKSVMSSSDVDMADEAEDDCDEEVSTHRSKFDRIRLDEYRTHLVDHASEVIQSFYQTCNVRLDSTNNNSNVDSMQMLTSSFSLDFPNTRGDVGISFPISLRHRAARQLSVQDELVKRRPRKKVSFTSAPSVKWFKKDDRIELPTNKMGKHNLIAMLRQLVLPQRKYRPRDESTCKKKVIPILTKKYKRLRA